MAANIPVFDEKTESWDSYRERLEHYFIALDIDDYIKKKSILINCIGPVYYERLRNLCFPSTPNDMDYDDLLILLSKLFTPPVVIFKERKEFYRARKYRNESASKWHERIRGLAIRCQFGDWTEQFLLDKFVTSFDSPVFEKFCEEETDLTLSKALEIAQRYDTIEGVGPTGPKYQEKGHQANQIRNVGPTGPKCQEKGHQANQIRNVGPTRPNYQEKGGYQVNQIRNVGPTRPNYQEKGGYQVNQIRNVGPTRPNYQEDGGYQANQVRNMWRDHPNQTRIKKQEPKQGSDSCTIA